jgi:hypothetical protein
MKTTWRTFSALGVHDHLLVAEAATLLVVAGLGLRVVPFLALRRLLNCYAGHTRSMLGNGRKTASVTSVHTDASLEDRVDRVARAVTAAANRFPRRTMTCLTQALAAHAMLARQGHASELRLGVRPSKPLEAHAWIECEGRIVIGQLENLAEYAVLSPPARP